MAIAATGVTGDSGDGTAANSTTVAASISPSTGNFLIVLVSWDLGGAGTITCTGVSDGSNAATGLTQQKDTATHQGIQLWYFPNIRSGITTITATFSATTDFRRILVGEFSGVLAAAPIDGTGAGQEQTAPGTGTDGVTSTAFTVTGTNSVIIGGVGFFTADTASCAAGTGFTSLISDIAGSPNVQVMLEYQVLTTSGSKAATFTSGSNVDAAVVAAAFKAAAGGGPVTSIFVTSFGLE